MKGLIRNNFYSMESNVKISFIIALFLSVVAFFVKHNAFIQMIISMQVFVFIVNVSSYAKNRYRKKWVDYSFIINCFYRIVNLIICHFNTINWWNGPEKFICRNGIYDSCIDNIYNLLFCFSKNISSQRV